jgi:hypothetical protein
VYGSKWQKKNSSKRNEDAKRRYSINAELYRQRSKNYRMRHPEKAKQWAEENADRLKLLQRTWRKNNPDRVAAHWKKSAEKIKTDPTARAKRRKTERIQSAKKYATIDGKLKISCRNRMNKVLSRSLRGSLTSSKLKYVGITAHELKQHLEGQFKDGMTWDNWSPSGWHIDHIRPLASFDLTKEDEREKAFHYSNLQPLWAKDNLSKGNNLRGSYNGAA